MTAGRERDGGGDDLDHAAVRTSTDAEPPNRGPVTGRARWEIFGGLAVAILVADQLAKAWIVANVDPVRPTLIVGDYLRLILSRNSGALFGLFRDQAPLFALFSFVVIGLIVWYHSRVGASVLLSVALGLLLGGAIGNLVDRLRYGYVVDFVDAGIGDMRWYTFNVADAAISTALLLLVLVAIRPSLAGPNPQRARTDA